MDFHPLEWIFIEGHAQAGRSGLDFHSQEWKSIGGRASGLDLTCT